MKSMVIPIEVSCYSGYTYAQEPRSFIHGGQCYQIRRTKAVWREPGGLFFRVELEGGKVFVVNYRESSHQWYLGMGG